MSLEEVKEKSINEKSSEIVSEMTEDDRILRSLGYTPTLNRVYSLVENFSASFTAVDTISGLRGLFTFGIAMGGPQAYWSTFLISAVFILITSSVLAETCSALPAAGSIYLWAAASGGPRFGRLFGTIVAFWSSMAWISFVASNSQVAAMYMFSEVSVFGLDFNTSTTDVKYRAAEWIVAEVILVICLLINYLPSRMYKYVFRVAMGIVILDTLLNLIWLPIGVSETYGFQDATFVFTNYENYTGLPNTWAWMLCFFATGGVQIGFDASGHVAEETKNASLVAARGLISSAIACTLCAIPIVLVFLFCTPNLDVLYSFGAPQPFVSLYALALGQHAHVVMTVVAILSTMASSVASIVAASRLVYAVARDGVLPFSGWISKISDNGQPKNAVTFMGIVAGILLCSIIPSSLAFQSLVSIAGVPTVAAWGLICFGRFFLCPKDALKPKFSLGKFSRPFQLIGFLWNTYLAAVLFSPQVFPVTAQNLNYAPIIMGIVTIFALCSYTFLSEERWLNVKKHLPSLQNQDKN